MKPLTLTAAMSAASIAGRKTETRRPLREQPPEGTSRVAYGPFSERFIRAFDDAGKMMPNWFSVLDKSAPFGMPGTELWLREPGRVVDYVVYEEGNANPGIAQVEYLSDGGIRLVTLPTRLVREDSLPSWLSRCQGIPNGIFREAARFKAVVQLVRVERLWDITESGAIAEGVEEAVKSWLRKYQPKWEPQSWLSPDNGETYCRRCAKKEARKLRREGKDVEVDGGWSLASIGSDVFEECASCGKLLETSVHDPSDYLPFDGEYDGYLTAEEIAMVYNFGEHSLSLKDGYAREAYRVLWDMIYGKRPGFAWADNPWVSVTKWDRMVAI